MSEVVQETEKKFYRRPGDPLRVHICRMDDPELNAMLQFAQRSGQVPYELKGWMCVDVLGGGLLWAAPDAVFQRVESGIYVFRDDDARTS